MTATNTSELRRVVLEQSRPSLRDRLERIDQHVSILLAQHSVTLLRVTAGVVFFWFGALKLQPGLSPAEHLIRESITFLPNEVYDAVRRLTHIFYRIRYGGHEIGYIQRQRLNRVISEIGARLDKSHV